MTYKVELIPSEEGYSVNCPELPGCRSQGETEQEALANIKSAISEYLAAASGHSSSEPVTKHVRYVYVPEPQADSGAETRKPFVVKPFRFGLPQNYDYDKTSQLLEELEGPLHH